MDQNVGQNIEPCTEHIAEKKIAAGRVSRFDHSLQFCHVCIVACVNLSVLFNNPRLLQLARVQAVKKQKQILCACVRHWCPARRHFLTLAATTVHVHYRPHEYVYEYSVARAQTTSMYQAVVWLVCFRPSANDERSHKLVGESYQLRDQVLMPARDHAPPAKSRHDARSV